MSRGRLKKFWFDTLRGRLILGVALVHAVMMTLFIIDLTGRQRAMLLDNQESEAVAMSHALATSAAGWIAANDLSGLQELTESQQRYPELLFAILADARGHVLAHTDQSKRGSYLLDLPGEARPTVLTKSAALVDVAVPAMLGGRPVGWVRIGIGQKQAARKLAEITAMGVIYSLAAILIGSLIAWRMGRQITQRLYTVQETISEVKSGVATARSTITGNDEAASIAREFNAMLDALAAREAALTASQDRFKKLFNAAAVPLGFVNNNGTLVDINDRFVQTFGYSLDDVPTLNEWWLLAYPDPAYRQWAMATWAEAVRKAAEEQSDIAPIEYDVTCKNGEVRTMIISGTIFDDHCLATFYDITARKRVTQELLAAKENWERTFAAIGDIATIQDPDHRILRANRRAGEVLGLNPEELIGKHCYEVFHGSSAPCDNCPAVHAASDSLPHRAEIRHEHLQKTFEVSASPVYSPDTEQLKTIYIARDITEVKTLAAQLRQAQKMEAIGTLAGGIAHDFNNILTPVLGYAEILAEELPADSPLSQPAHEILKAGSRARELVKQILNLSRQSELERRPVKIHLIVKEALKLLRASLPTTIDIRHQIDPQCGSVLADPTMLHQVVMNLCTNAYHAMMETGGTLAVSLKEVTIGAEDYITELHLRPGIYLQLEVSDTGGGIPAQMMERIFEPYFTTKDKGEGTGLGLSVVHGIVTSLGGHITVYSEPGQGASFHVYLPKSPDRPENDTARAPHAVLPRGDEHILVVDDEKVIVELMRQVLESLGYRITSCIDPRQAQDVFEAQPDDFDLVITDMSMPHLNGAELAQRLLARQPALPIILCTGFSEIINDARAKALGIRCLVMKPILKDELAKVIRQVLNSPAA